MPNIELNIKINSSPEKVYDALTKQEHLSKWWTTDCSAEPKVGSKATFNFKKANFHNVMEIIKLEPNERVEWKCVEAGDENSKEWEGTSVIWKITDNKDGTADLHLLHKDWKQESELYKACMDGWNHYAGDSLRSYLEAGKGKPFSDN
jgi:uncharacterized protein YndB with AHSA1/START domain